MEQLELDLVSEAARGRRGLKAAFRRMLGRERDSWQVKARERHAWQQGFRAGLANCKETHPDLFCRWVLESRDLDVRGVVGQSSAAPMTPGEPAQSMRRAS